MQPPQQQLLASSWPRQVLAVYFTAVLLSWASRRPSRLPLSVLHYYHRPVIQVEVATVCSVTGISLTQSFTVYATISSDVLSAVIPVIYAILSVEASSFA